MCKWWTVNNRVPHYPEKGVYGDVLRRLSHFTIMNTSSIQDFMSANKFVSVVKTVRENKNKYPYITFVNGANVAQNVYFSKNAAATVKTGATIERGFFAPFIATEVTYDDGRPTQWKISTKGESLRATMEDLF